jgi:hypothetical protein
VSPVKPVSISSGKGSRVFPVHADSTKDPTTAIFVFGGEVHLVLALVLFLLLFFVLVRVVLVFFLSCNIGFYQMVRMVRGRWSRRRTLCGKFAMAK